ncbi:hypothetical protein ACFV99_31270 [Streptomyces sp. NPDC059944]|uniref:hypothetical protein n=1 Tax=unclassified Streptomyces TaxID=2593676 RepID=UPI003652601D
MFGPLALGMLGLVVARDVPRARLRLATPIGLPVLTEAAAMIGVYLRAERDLGRIAPDADTDTLALTVVGTGHLRLAGRKDATPDPEAVRRMVDSVVAGVLREARDPAGATILRVRVPPSARTGSPDAHRECGRGVCCYSSRN